MPLSKVLRLAADEGSDWCPPATVPADAVRVLDGLIARREDALQPATDREIAVVLGRLSVHFGAADRPEEHHQLAYEDWLYDLADYPLAVLDAAATEWRRTQKWPPKICEMRALCDALLGPRRTELLRLRYLAWCVEAHGGRCPRLMRRIGDRLVDYGDVLTTHVIEGALAGRTEFPGDLVLALPGAAINPPPQPPPVAHQDIAALADELERQARRQRVLQILLAAGLTIRDIEAGQMLELDEGDARAVADEHRARATVIAAAVATEASGEVH